MLTPHSFLLIIHHSFENFTYQTHLFPVILTLSQEVYARRHTPSEAFWATSRAPGADASPPRHDDITLAHFLQIKPVVTNRLQKTSRWKKTNNTCTAVPVRRGTVPTSCGIPSLISLERKNIRNKPMVYTHTPEKEGNEGQKGKKHEKTREKKIETKKKHALRAQAESRGEKVGVC